MAEHQDSNERTEQPTERRKSEARKKGQVPRSRELNTLLSLVFASLGLLMLGSGITREFTALMESALTISREMAYDPVQMMMRLADIFGRAFLYLSPLLGIMVLGAFAGPLLMGGWSFSPEAMAFKWEKISPLSGIKRVFSAKGLLELLKALFKFAILLTVTWLLFMLFEKRILALGMLTPRQAIADSASLLAWSLLALSAGMIFVAIFDVPFELWNHNRQLKMTRQEIRDEMKETEGRPEVKGRIRNLQREMSRRRMMEAVPTADVVITNPTHFAVALKYDQKPGAAPMVVAKGRDLVAFRIRTLALEHNVAIFSAPPLARALYGSTEVGSEIPQNLYLAVAKVLAYVYQLNSSANSTFVTPPTDLDIPEEYDDLVNQGTTDGDE